MESLRTALYFIIVLSPLIIAHEWGHYIVAKLCGMRVKDFSLFFGKVLIPLGERNGTKYNIRMIPLGGFVSIAGMEPDDISNGAPILPGKTDTQKNFQKVLVGLTTEALESVNFSLVSSRVSQAINDAVDKGGQLTEEGRRELNALLQTTGINADEHRYIEAILNASAQQIDPQGYNQKPLWQRAATIFAGPFVSIALGYIIFFGMGVTVGLPDDAKTENAIEVISAGMPADKAGMKAGDHIIQIDDRKITEGRGMVDIIHANAGKSLHITVLRGDKTLQFVVIPLLKSIEIDGKTITQGQIGFTPKLDPIWKKVGLREAFGRGTEAIQMQVGGIRKALTSRKDAQENVGGPVAIAGIINHESKNGPRNLILLAGMLSISLGIMNLLPIPLLDGGHLMLLAYEGIRRRKLSSREMHGAQMVGMAIIATLFLLVMSNDIWRSFHG